MHIVSSPFDTSFHRISKLRILLLDMKTKMRARNN
jgi:hypothetical protein